MGIPKPVGAGTPLRAFPTELAMLLHSCNNGLMGRFLASIWLWLVVYLAVLIGIGAYVIHLRNQMLSDEAEIAKEQESYRQWIEFAKTQTGSTGPVQRTVPTSSELPMLVLMRDHFPVILGASIIFPAIILGFLLLMFHGVLRQSLDRQASERAAGIDDSA